MESKSITRNEEFIKSVEDIMTGNITPITREEILWAKVLGENVPDIVPVIRKEIFLAKITGADIQTPKPITREEMYLDAIANGTELKLKPITRKEMFYAKVLGLTDSAPEPVTRLEQILDQVETNGGGGEENYDKYSWEGVRAAIKNGNYKDVYKVGDLVPLDLGTEGVVNMQIIAFDTDDLADGSGKAPITWLSEQLLATSQRMNGDRAGSSGAYTEGTGGIGGWEKCEMRTYLQETIKPKIPQDVSNAIKEVAKVHPAYKQSAQKFTQTTTDDIWIPSYAEMFGESSLYYGMFQDSDTLRIKYKTGDTSASYWWLRSARDTFGFYGIGASGKYEGSYARTPQGVVLGFCT